MAKDPDAFRTISEAAQELDLPQHVLRFWETRFNQIKPMKRAGGRRYYRTEDVDLLRGIKGLLYDRGYTIKGVQKVLKERGVKHVAGLSNGALSDDAVQAPQEPDIVVGAVAPRAEGDAPVNGTLADGDRALLQEVLLDLLECKRVLDQAR